jgi:hypothetical protein
MNLRERVIPLNITEQGQTAAGNGAVPYCYTIPWGKVSGHSKHATCTYVEYLLFQKIHIKEINRINMHTREINMIIISWIYPRDNYPFQLEYYFHGRGELKKR